MFRRFIVNRPTLSKRGNLGSVIRLDSRRRNLPTRGWSFGYSVIVDFSGMTCCGSKDS